MVLQLKINLEILDGEQQGNCYVFKGGILELMYNGLAWSAAQRMFDALVVFLNISSISCTGINFKHTSEDKVRQNRKVAHGVFKALQRVLMLTGSAGHTCGCVPWFLSVLLCHTDTHTKHSVPQTEQQACEKMLSLWWNGTACLILIYI